MSWDKPRCIWCHRAEGDFEPLRVLIPKAWSSGTRDVSVSVHPEHRKKMHRYYDKVHRFSHVFLYSVLLGCAAPFVFLAFRWGPSINAALAYLGILLLLFPFCTLTTVELLGIRNSMRLAQAIGVVFILAGMRFLVL